MFKKLKSKIYQFAYTKTNLATWSIYIATFLVALLATEWLTNFMIYILIPYILWLTQAYDKGRYFVKIHLSTTAGYFIFKEWCEDIVYKVYIGKDKPKTFLYEFAELIKRLQNLI